MTDGSNVEGDTALRYRQPGARLAHSGSSTTPPPRPTTAFSAGSPRCPTRRRRRSWPRQVCSRLVRGLPMKGAHCTNAMLEAREPHACEVTIIARHVTLFPAQRGLGHLDHGCRSRPCAPLSERLPRDKRRISSDGGSRSSCRRRSVPRDPCPACVLACCPMTAHLHAISACAAGRHCPLAHMLCDLPTQWPRLRRTAWGTASRWMSCTSRPGWTSAHSARHSSARARTNGAHVNDDLQALTAREAAEGAGEHQLGRNGRATRLGLLRHVTPECRLDPP